MIRYPWKAMVHRDVFVGGAVRVVHPWIQYFIHSHWVSIAVLTGFFKDAAQIEKAFCAVRPKRSRHFAKTINWLKRAQNVAARAWELWAGEERRVKRRSVRSVYVHALFT